MRNCLRMSCGIALLVVCTCRITKQVSPVLFLNTQTTLFFLYDSYSDLLSAIILKALSDSLSLYREFHSISSLKTKHGLKVDNSYYSKFPGAIDVR